LIEYDYLAPDSINEIFEALQLLKKFTGIAYAKKNKKKYSDKEMTLVGEKLLEEKDEQVDKLEILAEGFENSRRKTELIKVLPAYGIFKELITYYGISQLVNYIAGEKIDSWEIFSKTLPMDAKRNAWENAGGQLLPKASVETLVKQIHSDNINTWDGIHDFYKKNAEIYKDQKLQHAFASLFEINKLTSRKFDKKLFKNLLDQAVTTREWMTKAIYDSRAKDFHNDFRQMVYTSQKQMDKVLGKLDENSFIKQQVDEFRQFKKQVNSIIQSFYK